MSSQDYYTGALVTMAAVAPCDLLVKELEKAIIQYKQESSSSSEKDKEKVMDKHLGFATCLILLKSIGGNPVDLLKRFEELQRVDKLIHPNKS
jgi:hypothetical protein